MNEEIEKKMLEMATSAMKNSYSPYSKFRVGACVLGDDDQLYAGCNVENASYSITQCAERNAIANMFAHGGRAIKAVLVVADSDTIVTPCGACRQHIREFSGPDVPVYMYSRKGDRKVMTMKELLPESFGPEFL